jgi:hypothetical protein
MLRGHDIVAHRKESRFGFSCECVAENHIRVGRVDCATLEHLQGNRGVDCALFVLRQ